MIGLPLDPKLVDPMAIIKGNHQKQSSKRPMAIIKKYYE